jgi:hypothetical protein
MDRHLIDRWTDTTVFRCLLLFSAMAVLPVLAMGILTTVIRGAAMLYSRSAVDLEQAVFGLLSMGGMLGFFGYLRALHGAKDPERLSVTATLIFLAAGVVTALVVVGFALASVLDVWKIPLNAPRLLAAPALFAAANFVWAIEGAAWMQRLPRRYAEKTGRVFDGLPVTLLFVAIALATAALLRTTAL